MKILKPWCVVSVTTQTLGLWSQLRSSMKPTMPTNAPTPTAEVPNLKPNVGQYQHRTTPCRDIFAVKPFVLSRGNRVEAVASLLILLSVWVSLFARHALSLKIGACILVKPWVSVLNSAESVGISDSGASMTDAK